MSDLKHFSTEELQEELEIRSKTTMVVAEGETKESWYDTDGIELYKFQDAESRCSTSAQIKDLMDFIKASMILPKGSRFIKLLFSDGHISWCDSYSCGFENLDDDWAEKHLCNIKEVSYPYGSS